MPQSPELQAFRESIFGREQPGICITCRRPVFGFRDALSVKEYGLSHMCQHCQDDAFADVEAIAEELGFDMEKEYPRERELLEWAQQSAPNVEAQRWIAAALYQIAYRRED